MMIRLSMTSEMAMAGSLELLSCKPASTSPRLFYRKLSSVTDASALVTKQQSSCKGLQFRSKALESNQPQTAQDDVAPPGCSRVKVELKKPLGLRLEEDAGNVFVVEVLAGGNAEKSGLVEVGDQLIATSAIIYADEETYQGVNVRKGMQVVRLNVRGERFETVVAAIGTHPGHMKVVLELQKCK